MGTESNNKQRKSSNEYMKYAGLATTMFVTMFIMYWLGSKIDAYMENEVNYFGLAFIVLSLFAFFYKLIKELS